MSCWGRWELKERIRSSAEGDIYRLESRRMNRTESALMKVVPLIAAFVLGFLFDMFFGKLIEAIKRQ